LSGSMFQSTQSAMTVEKIETMPNTLNNVATEAATGKVIAFLEDGTNSAATGCGAAAVEGVDMGEF